MSTPKLNIKQFNPEILERRRLMGSPPTIVIIGRRGTGKCMGINTPVIMADGKIKMIQDIVEGDKLIGDDNCVRNVIGTTTGRDLLYKVCQKNGDDYVVNGNHILSLKYNRADCSRTILGTKLIKGDILEIPVNEYIKLNKNEKEYLVGYKVSINFPKKEVPIDPYLIGLWLGDGTSANTEFTNQDSVILHYLAHKLPEYDCYLNNKKSKKYGYRFNGVNTNNFVLQTLKDLDLINNKHIPDIYKYNSRENQLKLLAGLLDTDGSLDSCNGYDFIQKNHQLSKDVQFIVRSLGLSSTIVECKKSCMYKGTKREGIYFRQHITGNGIEEIPCLIKRKKASIRKQIKNNLHTGIKIEPIGEGDYYGFQIDGNQRYLLGDFTVTHNSTLIKDLLYSLRRMGMLVCMSGTEEGNEFYKSILHPLCVHGSYNKPVVSGIIKRQKAKLKELNAKGIDPLIKPEAAASITTGLLLDDLGYDKKVMKENDIRQIFMNGRHWKICFIVSLQYMMDISPDLRTNIDFVFVLRDNIKSNQERLWKYFFGCFQKFSHFQQAFIKCTDDYHCLVLDNTTKSTKLEDNVFWYKAKLGRQYKIGTPEMWRYLDSIHKKDDEEDEMNNIPNNSGIIVKKDSRLKN